MSGQELPSLGKYHLVQRIATGGMAEIYKAIYDVGEGIEKTCVVKRLLPHLAENPEFIDMFKDEARISVGLSHANFVHVFDFGQEDGQHFLAMEYVRGQNLEQILFRAQTKGELVPGAIGLQVIAEIARGLHYAHTRKDERGVPLGIVHRDVSPGNILLSYEGDIKLADFGIAKAASTQKTQAGFIKGKASYLSPEQVLSKEIDARTDVFALGIVLWEILAGQKLFSGGNELEIINKVSRDAIMPPSTVNASLHYELDEVVMTALQRNPKLRYQTAEAFREALNRLMTKFNVAVGPDRVAEYVSASFAGEKHAELEADKELSKSFAHQKKKRRGFFARMFGRKAKPDISKVPVVPSPSGSHRVPPPLPETETEKTPTSSDNVSPPPPTSVAPARSRAEESLGLALAMSSTRVHQPDAYEKKADALPTGAGVRDRMAEASARKLRRDETDRIRRRRRRRPVVLGLLLLVTASGVLLFGPELGLPNVPVVSPWVADVRANVQAKIPALPPFPTRASTAVPTPSVGPTATATPVRKGKKKVRRKKAKTLSGVGAPGAGSGRLSIDSTPKGEIFVDGVAVGLSTPARDLTVPVGSYLIRIVNKKRKLEARFVVEVTQDKPVKRRVKLTPIEDDATTPSAETTASTPSAETSASTPALPTTPATPVVAPGEEPDEIPADDPDVD